MTVTAHDVAREIRNHIANVGDVRLQKLLYYCQGLHLAWYGEAMFPEPIEAWDMGPVVPEVRRVDLYGTGSEGVGREPLEQRHVGVLDEVLSRYGRLNARELIDLTHAEGPWKENYLSERDMYGRSATIPLDAIAAWFREQERMIEVETEAARLVADHPHLRMEPGITPEVDALIAAAVAGPPQNDRR